MIGPGVATSPAMPQATPAADAAGFRGEATPGTEGGNAASAFERLMEPAAAASAPAASSSTPAETTDALEGAPDTAEGTPTAADPSQLLALLSQAAMATTAAAAPASGAGTASTSVGSVAAAQAAAARSSTAVGGAGLMTSGTAMPPAAGTASATDAAVPPFGTADGPGAMPLPADLATGSAAMGPATAANRNAANPASSADPAALLAQGLPGSPAAPAAPAAATPSTVADAASLAVTRDDALASIEATRGGDPASDGPAWLTAALPPSATSSTSASAPTAPAPLAMPADPADGFDDGLTTHLSWMAAQGMGEARIRITPDHLGTIDLVLNIDGQRISAEFQSAHADVRQALEGGLGRLRDQLAQHGLQLVQAQVGDGGDSRRSPRRDDTPAQGGDPRDRAEAAFVNAPVSAPVRRARLLDTYA